MKSQSLFSLSLKGKDGYSPLLRLSFSPPSPSSEAELSFFFFRIKALPTSPLGDLFPQRIKDGDPLSPSFSREVRRAFF